MRSRRLAQMVQGNFPKEIIDMENQDVTESTSDCKKISSSKGDMIIAIELHSILKELKTITQKLKDDKDDEGKSLDWKFAAMVIDRLCMVIFAFATFLSAILILFTSKNILKKSDPSFYF
jgi:hypothetical protein